MIVDTFISICHLISFDENFIHQVRFKAICILESIVRKNDDDHFSIVTSYFTENQDAVIGCSESPQASLREKASKVNYQLIAYLQNIMFMFVFPFSFF